MLLATNEARAGLANPVAARRNTALKPVLVVADLERARERLRRLGGDVNGPERMWTFRDQLACDALDPEGNVIQLRSIA